MKIIAGLARCSHCRRIMLVRYLDPATGICRPQQDCAAHREIARLHALGHPHDLVVARRIERELYRLEGMANKQEEVTDGGETSNEGQLDFDTDGLT